MAKIENFQQAEEAIGVLAAGHMELEAALDANLKLGELVRLQDTQIRAQDMRLTAQAQQIRLLVAMVDHHHDIFIKQGLATPRPVEETTIVH